MAISAQPIGITLPVMHGPTGYFNHSYNIADQINSNLTMLFQTRKGERRLNPNFGSNLWNVIFEFNDDNLPQIVESTIRRDIATWMPFVNVSKTSINTGGTTEDAQHAIGVSITYTVNSAGITTPQTLDLTLQQGSL